MTAVQEGFLGTLIRTSILTTGGYLVSKRRGAVFTGILPDSLIPSEHNRIDYIIVHQIYLKEPNLLSIFEVHDLRSIIKTFNTKLQTMSFHYL